jgi:3-hydroxybutyryl-CoA dehydratase
MLLGKKRRLGRQIEEIKVGEKLERTEKIEDKDILLYLGLSDDGNPLFIQHDYASQTPFKKPIVPQVMLTGIVTSAVSKYLPGPGSAIMKQTLEFIKPVYHYSSFTSLFEVTNVDHENHLITISVIAKDEEGDDVIKGELKVCPPHRVKPLTAATLDNF